MEGNKGQKICISNNYTNIDTLAYKQLKTKTHKIDTQNTLKMWITKCSACINTHSFNLRTCIQIFRHLNGNK